MSKPPFGFDASNSNDDDDDNLPEKRSGDDAANPPQGGPGGSPFPFGFTPGGPAPDFSQLGPMFEQLQRMFTASSTSGPVNWDLAKQAAVAGTRGTEKPASMTAAEIEQAMHIADLWLSDATDFPSGVQRTQAWTRSEWVEQSLPVWSQLCTPVASRLVEAMTALLPSGSGGEDLEALRGLIGQLPPGLEQMLAGAGGFRGIFGQMGGVMFGTQFGQALGKLATEVLTGSDIGLPLTPEGTAVLLPQNIEEFAADLDVEIDEVRLYLALREAAYQRLFAHVPWLKKKLLGTVEAYAAGITIDRDAIERQMNEIRPEEIQANPEKLQEIMSSGVLEPQTSPEQKQQLESLETLLALVEGWVDRVVSQAAGERLPSADSLGEMMRRRRATGGPAEHTFASLVGLELRPRRLRDAARLWAHLEELRGLEGRDAVWEHPDLLPTPADLDDPEKFGTPSEESGSFTDADLQALLDGEAPGKPDSGPDKPDADA